MPPVVGQPGPTFAERLCRAGRGGNFRCMKVLVTGGIRCGKSLYAENLLADASAVTYVTPGYAADPSHDPEWAARVYNHQKRYDEAIKMHLKAYEISKNLDIRLDMAQSLVWLPRRSSGKHRVGGSRYGNFDSAGCCRGL